MKRHLAWAALAGILAGILILVWGSWQWNRPGPEAPGPEAGPAQVRIRAGMTLSAAADTLVGRGLLRDARVLLLGAKLTGQGRALRAGLYELEYGRSPSELLTDLTSGRTVQVRFTLPEGLSAEEIAERAAAALGFSAEGFLAAADSIVRAEAARQDWMTGGAGAFARLDTLLQGTGPGGVRTLHWCEGYLAPDTYRFGEGTPDVQAAAHLVHEQLRRLRQAWTGRERTELTGHQLLALASLVEAEARLPEERGRIAAVYTNRLQQRWRLEADPTVAYALRKKGKRLYFKDLKVDSPYNTYLYRGLPPGPIGCPGQPALQAAARPESDVQDLYFVSDGAGGHVFSRTLQEHEAAVRRYRRIRDEAARH